MNWLDLAREAPWILGSALFLAAVSDAAYVKRGASVTLRHLLSGRSHRQAVAVAVGLLVVGFLLAARALWMQVVSALFLIAFAGWLFWRWLERARGPELENGHRREKEIAQATATREPEASPRRPLAWAEFTGIGFAAPLLWFPTLRPALTILAIALLLLTWLAVALAGGRLWPRSRYDLALIVLLSMAGVAAFRSTVPALTLPKVTSLILGVAGFRLILRLVRDRRSLAGSLCAMLALALLFALVGLTNGLRTSKVPPLGVQLGRLPRFIQELPDTQRGQVSLNQLGGALLYVIPLGLSCALAPPLRKQEGWGIAAGARVLAGVVTLFLGAGLLLTQSRGAWTGMLVGLMCIVGLSWPWGKWVVLGLLIAALTAWLLWGRSSLSAALLQAFTSTRGSETSLGSVSLTGRLEIWSRAFGCIQSSPWLGCGLGTFRLLNGDASAAKSVFDVGTPHAHNVFLQVAYDLGWPGLAAYLATLFLGARICWRVYRSSGGFPRALAIGGLSALVAYHVYGITDVVTLGSKPGVLWWALLALIAVLGRLTGQADLVSRPDALQDTARVA